MSEMIDSYQWLVGLIIGFILNQLSITLNRKRKLRDRKRMFKSHILFIRYKLDYVSEELVKIPNITYASEEGKNNFIQSVVDTREYLLHIPKYDIPENLMYEVSDLTSDYLFLINSMKNTKVGKRFFYFEKEDIDDDRREFAIEVVERQRKAVKIIFKQLKIESKY